MKTWRQISPAAHTKICAIAAAYRLPLISEDVHDNHWFPAGMNLYYRYDDLVENAVKHIHSGDLQAHGDLLYEHLCIKYPFKYIVEAHV